MTFESFWYHLSTDFFFWQHVSKSDKGWRLGSQTYTLRQAARFLLVLGRDCFRRKWQRTNTMNLEHNCTRLTNIMISSASADQRFGGTKRAQWVQKKGPTGPNKGSEGPNIYTPTTYPPNIKNAYPLILDPPKASAAPP